MIDVLFQVFRRKWNVAKAEIHSAIRICCIKRNIQTGENEKAGVILPKMRKVCAYNSGRSQLPKQQYVTSGVLRSVTYCSGAGTAIGHRRAHPVIEDEFRFIDYGADSVDEGRGAGGGDRDDAESGDGERRGDDACWVCSGNAAGPAGAPGVTDSPAGGLSTAPGAAPVSAAGSSAATTVVSLTDGIPVPVELAEDVPLDAPAGAVLKFRATENLMAAGAVVIAKGAAVEGRVVDETKKRALGLVSKMTFELVGAETAGGQKVKLRATPSADKGGSHAAARRGCEEEGEGSGSVEADSEFVAYVDGAQTVSVKK